MKFLISIAIISFLNTILSIENNNIRKKQLKTYKMAKPENEDIKNPDNSEKEAKDKTKDRIVNFNDDDELDQGNITSFDEPIGGENDDEFRPTEDYVDDYFV